MDVVLPSASLVFFKSLSDSCSFGCQKIFVIQYRSLSLLIFINRLISSGYILYLFVSGIRKTRLLLNSRHLLQLLYSHTGSITVYFIFDRLICFLSFFLFKYQICSNLSFRQGIYLQNSSSPCICLYASSSSEESSRQYYITQQAPNQFSINLVYLTLMIVKLCNVQNLCRPMT